MTPSELRQLIEKANAPRASLRRDRAEFRLRREMVNLAPQLLALWEAAKNSTSRCRTRATSTRSLTLTTLSLPWKEWTE